MLGLGQADPLLLPLFDGSTHGPKPVGEDEIPVKSGIAPDWLVEKLQASGVSSESMQAMSGRAALDVRVNALKADCECLELPEHGEPLAAPQALRFPSGTPVEQWDAYRDGQIEIQDHGSQLACLAADARPGETVIDLCAGAEGKTLAMAAAMQNRGELVACDTDMRRLSRLAPRAKRAGAGLITERLLNPKWEMETLDDFIARADMVLVDAPCSGTGTWRRKPEAKWRLTPERLARFASIQDHLLEVAAKLTRKGGRIAFVTCSLLDNEGSDRVVAFLDRHSDWSAEACDLPLGRLRGKGTRLDPFHDGTDGFFIAILRSSC